MKAPFLKAEWRKLAMANYVVDPKVLLPYVPYATEIDFWNGQCYVSLVGFMFLNTRIKGLAIPYHVNFEEVNLRFYVRYKEHNEWKRGVVFIKEIVPRPAITWVANTLYKENYETLQMGHSWAMSGPDLSVEYRWRKSGWNRFQVKADRTTIAIEDGSEAEFITEHFWGYTKFKKHQSFEYGVEHPRWSIYPARETLIDVDFNDVYGQAFAFLKDKNPHSVYLAEGSEIIVRETRTITAGDLISIALTD